MLKDALHHAAAAAEALAVAASLSSFFTAFLPSFIIVIIAVYTSKAGEGDGKAEAREGEEGERKWGGEDRGEEYRGGATAAVSAGGTGGDREVQEGIYKAVERWGVDLNRKLKMEWGTALGEGGGGRRVD